MFVLALPGLIAASVAATTYSIAQNYSGSTFFNGWDFQQGPDVTNWGNVSFQSGPDAQSQGLIHVNSAGHAIIKADNTTVGNSTTYVRASVLMSSQATINHGSLVLFSAFHMPYGCSVWPAFWTLGGNASNWPEYGEIDIVENINLATNNQYSIHTSEGCSHPATSSGVETGTIGQTDCWNETAYNSGCIVVENQPNNYGAGFAQNGGGGIAFLWDDIGMRFWFFPRANMPADFSTGSPNPSNWGLPSALYPQASCDFATHFGPQSLKLEIDICGGYAGVPGIFNGNGLCQGLCTDLVNNPRNYDTAYFEIEYLRIFTELSSFCALFKCLADAALSNRGAVETSLSSASSLAPSSASSSTSPSQTRSIPISSTGKTGAALSILALPWNVLGFISVFTVVASLIPLHLLQ